MEPFLREGDHVLTFNWVLPKRGNVIVFRSGDMYLVKRVDRIREADIFISGDNKKLSKKLGPIGKGKIVGKVVLKY